MGKHLRTAVAPGTPTCCVSAVSHPAVTEPTSPYSLKHTCTHTLGVIPRIYAHALCYPQMPKPHANNTLWTERLPATDPHPTSVHTHIHTPRHSGNFCNPPPCLQVSSPNVSSGKRASPLGQSVKTLPKSSPVKSCLHATNTHIPNLKLTQLETSPFASVSY